MTIAEIQNQIISEFSDFDEWLDKYNYLIGLSRSLPLLDACYKTDKYLISGCQSRVWLRASLVGGKVRLTADSDAIITRGIVNLLIRVFSDQTPRDILEAPVTFIDTIGLKEHLSPTRANGLSKMLEQITVYAVIFMNDKKPGSF